MPCVTMLAIVPIHSSCLCIVTVCGLAMYCGWRWREAKYVLQRNDLPAAIIIGNGVIYCGVCAAAYWRGIVAAVCGVAI